MKINTVKAAASNPGILICILACVCFLAMACGNGRDRLRKTEDTLVLAGATIYPAPGEEAIEEGVILIKGGIIEAVGKPSELEISPTAKWVDCKGLFITAGFWNSHIHFHQPEWQGADSLPASRLESQ